MHSVPQTQLISVAAAIIYQDGKYLMQLRDELPTIVYPGVWGFFGGHVEPGESPEIALKRELMEEINYAAPELTMFYAGQAGKYLRHLFSCPLKVSVSELELKEGWDLKLLTPGEIQQGFAYSAKAIANKPVGDIHRQILLDFMASATQY
ncbi:MAG: NUDIX domain-containing protein [Hydrococcus sp. SU_1_0]|nr:NUDIX domain-containing protein [Hydrococcus sp. SU_1_0]